MRLISQDGMDRIYDLPYDKCLVYIYGDKKTIKVQPLCEVDSEYVFATYSTEAKALKVMEMLRKAYVGLPILFQNVDMNESVVEKLKEWKRDGIALLHDNAETKIEQVNNAIFVFPKDEEVEV